MALTIQELTAQIKQLEDSNKAKDERIASLSKAAEAKVTVKIGEKGTISVYGMGKFPVSLYAGQWMTLDKHFGAVKNVIQNGLDKCVFKTEEQKAAVKDWLAN